LYETSSYENVVVNALQLLKYYTKICIL